MHQALRACLYALSSLLVIPVAAADVVQQHLSALQSGMDARAVAVLSRIEGLGRQLLAARSYLRSEVHLAERWSWSQERIDAYLGSCEQAQLDAEIARVRTAFEAKNPGFTLYVNPAVRSLETQLERWNENAGVAAAGEAMLAAVRRALAADPSAGATNSLGRDAFKALLVTYTPVPAAPLAAPGLSRHGQMNAVDFQVWRGEEPVARPNVAEIGPVWDTLGWRRKLEQAVAVAGPKFAGPLQNPDEPWHYEFQPELDGAACGC